MAFSEFERERIDSLVLEFLQKKRPPSELRDQVDFGYRIEKQSVILFEVRPVWNNPQKRMESPFAKATYIATQKVWRLFWFRADLNWHLYDPTPEVDRIEGFLAVVDRDEHHCFFG